MSLSIVGRASSFGEGRGGGGSACARAGGTESGQGCGPRVRTRLCRGGLGAPGECVVGVVVRSDGRVIV